MASLADAAKVDKARFPTLSDLDWLDRVLHRGTLPDVTCKLTVLRSNSITHERKKIPPLF